MSVFFYEEDGRKNRIKKLLNYEMLLAGARKKRRKSPRGKSKDRQSESSDKDEVFPVINIRWLYVFFLSARNVHVPAAICLALASSVGLSTLSMTFGALHNCCYCAFTCWCLPGNCLVLLCPTGSCCVCPVWNKLFSASRGEIPELS